MMALAMRSRSPSGTSSRHLRAITSRSSASKSNASRQGRQPSRWCWISTRRYSVSSPSRKWYSVWMASTQSTNSVSPCGAPAAMSSSFTTVRYQPSLHTELEQRLLQRLSSTVEPAHDRSDRDLEDLGDLLVRETLDIGQQHGHPELLGE